MHIAQLDVDSKQLETFVLKLIANKLKFRVVTYDGPGGGNPCIGIEYSDRAELKDFLYKNYDPNMIDDDFDLYCGVEE
jgi:hypothetical protein